MDSFVDSVDLSFGVAFGYADVTGIKRCIHHNVY